MHREPDAFLQQVVGGRWRLLEILGPTEHGAAFRAETLDDGRPTRVELWDERHVERRGEMARFDREARTLSRLRHERCAAVVAFGAHEGRPFLVSELPEGKTLREEVDKAELTVARAVTLGLQLCDGLRHLHGHGVVHRAVLPENVWVAQSPAADSLKIGLPRIGLTTEPSGPRPDHRADLHAAGQLLDAMCRGREPGREIGEALERVILRAVAPSPDARFQTADELMTALQSAGAHPTTSKRRPAQRPRKRTAMFATAFATVAVLVAGALSSNGGQGPTASRATPPVQLPSIPAKVSVQPAALPPSLPRPTMAATVVEPKPAPAPAPPPAAAPIAAPIVATSSPAASHDERSEIWSLLDSGRLDEGATRLKPLVARDPDAAWPRFALGVLYYRKYWRHDSVTQWKLALAQDREIRNDPQFGEYLCFMLDDTWKAAGVTDLLNQLGAGAVPLLEHCVASAKTPRLRALAAHTLDGLRQADHGSRPGRARG